MTKTNLPALPEFDAGWGGFKRYEDAAKFHDFMGGWLLVMSGGLFQVETDCGVVKDLRGCEWMDECDRQQCWDETLLQEAAA